MTTYTLTTPHAEIGPYSLREIGRLEKMLRPYHEFIIIRRVPCVPASRASFDRPASFAKRCVQGQGIPTPHACSALSNARSTAMKILLTMCLGSALAATSCASIQADTFTLTSAKRKPAAPQTSCARAAVQVVGAESLLRSRAVKSAENKWREAVRNAHGEKFMDLASSRHKRLTCTASGTRGYSQRCSLSALPCEAQ